MIIQVVSAGQFNHSGSYFVPLHNRENIRQVKYIYSVASDTP